jgi:hypothetical protein
MKAKDKPVQAKKSSQIQQPEPVTPGVSKAMVRQHAFEIYRDKLAHGSLTLEDWVLAEKDLVNTLEADNLPK